MTCGASREARDLSSGCAHSARLIGPHGNARCRCIVDGSHAGGVESYVEKIIPALRAAAPTCLFSPESDGPTDRARIDIGESRFSCCAKGVLMRVRRVGVEADVLTCRACTIRRLSSA